MSSSNPQPGTGPAVSSPVSTGGGGTHFEQLVNAYWLAQLLVNGIPPIVTKGRVGVVHFQTELLGWNTDDFLVEVDVGPGPSRRLAGQVKRGFTVSASDEECSKAISDFWKDYKNPAVFDATRDCFVLVVQRGSKVLLDHLGGLLDAARAANSADEFVTRLEVKGLLHATAHKYLDEIRTIVTGSTGAPPQAADLWGFLRAIHLLALDLGTSTAQTESSARTLLALTARGPDQVAAATASWNALVVLASGAMPQARTFKRDDLPNDLTALHEAIGANARDALTALEQHSALVRGGISTTLGASLHLPRPGLSAEVHRALANARVVLISGPSGSGKSAVAADCIASMKETFCFSFRAEEFAHPHLDDSLSRAQVPANAETLRALLATQGRVLFHVESVERLLEANQREAFADLLTLMKGEPNWQLVLTCRDYSLDLVRSAFLQPKGIDHKVVEVPPLDESSLTVASNAYEKLKIPLGDPALKALLTNPYYLDAALRIDWSGGADLPTGAREFRSRFWRDVIRMDQDRSAGMPQRRHRAFVDVAVRRARELRAWVPCGDLDQDALSALQRDSLVAQSKANLNLWAPAHDVLEDWAILTALDEDYAAHEGSVRGMALLVDGYPALRRTLRRWLGELALQGDGGDRAFEMAVAGDGLAPWLRDDILAALLGGKGAAELLSRHAEALFRDGCALLTRIIHLVRVACVRTPAWADGLNYAILEPTGTAWAALAEIVAANVQRLSAKQMPQVLSFVEDWAKGVTMWRPHPPGEAAVVSIAHVLAEHFDGHQTRDQQRRAFSVIAKCPSADTGGVRRLLGLSEDRADQERDAAIRSREFREQVLTELDGNFIALLEPDAVIEACRSFFLLGEKDEDRDRYRGYRLELEHIFGLDSVTQHAFFPASAYHGPYLVLLRWHRQKGLEFVLEIVNHCCDSYVADRPGDRLEPTVEVTVTRPDGVAVKHHANQRFYALYRGSMTVGPNWLQTLLMATEQALFDLAEENAANLDAWLLWLLSKTNCAAVAGVVASVAVAHPRSAQKTILTLITCREYVMLDRLRMAQESRSLSAVFDAFPNADRQVFVDERKKSDQLPHRKRDLEWAALLLQLGPEAPQVHALLDAHLASLPPPEAQTPEDKTWRFALHRMDLRKYTPEVRSAIGNEAAEATGSDQNEGDGASAESESSSPDASSEAVIALVPNELQPDLAEMSRETGNEMAEMGERLGLWMWGQKAYERSSDVDPSEWRPRLQQASTLKATTRPMLGEGGPAFVAAVCVRDHWSEMDEGQRSWCVEVASSVVEAGDEDWSGHGQASQGMMDGSGACANALAFVLGQERGSPPVRRAASAFSVALTHPSLWLRWHAAHAVAQHLTLLRREVVWLCVNTVAFHATLAQERLKRGSRRKVVDEQWERMQRVVAVEVRGRFLRSLEAGAAEESADEPTLPTGAFDSINLSTWQGADAAALSLAMLARSGGDRNAVAAHARLARTLVGWWDQDAKSRHSEARHRRSHETVLGLTKLIARYAHGCVQDDADKVLAPIFGAVDTHPDKAEDVLQEVIFEEDRVRAATNFWHIWCLFAARMESAGWLPRMDDRYPSAASLVRAVFLCSWWKDDARHWTPLEGRAHLLGELLLRLPTSPLALESYVRFLYRVGRRSIPAAFVTVAEYVKREPVSLLSVSNSVFVLEVMLREWVYGHPAELRRDPRLREAVLSLLDSLVEVGSSTSFRMRDDFVTPLREG